MSKFSQTIHNLYNKFLPIAQNSGVELNLDYTDPSAIDIDIEADDPELKAELETELQNAITRANSGSVKLKIKNGVISISDTGTVLSHPLCEALSHGRVKVKSRTGFGTSVDISLAKTEKTTDTPDALPTQESTAKSAVKSAKDSPKKSNSTKSASKSTKNH